MHKWTQKSIFSEGAMFAGIMSMAPPPEATYPHGVNTPAKFHIMLFNFV